MSLIQEALKRQQEDGESSSDAKKPAPTMKPPVPQESASTKEILPGISATPPDPINNAASQADAAPSQADAPLSRDKATLAPPPPPPPPAEEKPATASSSVPPTQTPILESTEKPNRNKPILIGVVILLIIFVGIKLIFKPSEESSTEENLPEEVVVEETQIASSADETETHASKMPTASTEATEVEDTTTTEATATPAEETPAVVVPEKIQWPSLTLTAVMGKGKKGSAMINGELIGVGDSIEDAEFVAVGKNGIYLQYKGESRFLKRGQTIF